MAGRERHAACGVRLTPSAEGFRVVLMSRQRIGLWGTLIFAVLVVVGMIVQVYLVATFAFDSVGETGADAIDAHKDLGKAVHVLYILTFLSALVAAWPNWRATVWPFSLAVLGTIQAFLAGGDTSPGVHAFHGALVPIVFLIAFVIAWRAYTTLRIGSDRRLAT
jgi:hypothetical protein